MKTEDEASKRACEILRKIHLTESEMIVGAFDDNFIIERYQDEWSLFMDGWRETVMCIKKRFPNDEQIEKQIEECGLSKVPEGQQYYEGAKWIRDFVLAVSPFSEKNIAGNGSVLASVIFCQLKKNKKKIIVPNTLLGAVTKRKVMNESQKIVYRMALENLKKAIPRQDIVSGAALGLHKDKEGNPQENKYTGWAKESDEMNKELREALRLFQILQTEMEL